MQLTSNLSLKKPDGTDVVDIADLNGNSDIIDGKFGASVGHKHTGAAGDGPRISASNITVADAGNNFTAGDVEGALTELFTNVSNGKNAIASAITGMGQAAAGSETFASLSSKISAISTDANAAVGDVLSGKTFYQGGVKRTGTISKKIGWQTASWVDGAAYPGRLYMHAPAGYYNGQDVPNGSLGVFYDDPEFVAGNIVNGVNIFGLIGTAYKAPGTFLDPAGAIPFTFYRPYDTLLSTTSDGRGAIGCRPDGTISRIYTYWNGSQNVVKHENYNASGTLLSANDIVYGIVGNSYGIAFPNKWYRFTGSNTYEYDYSGNLLRTLNTPTMDGYGQYMRYNPILDHYMDCSALYAGGVVVIKTQGGTALASFDPTVTTGSAQTNNDFAGWDFISWNMGIYWSKFAAALFKWNGSSWVTTILFDSIGTGTLYQGPQPIVNLLRHFAWRNS